AAEVAAYPFAAADDPREGERVLGRFAFRWLLANLQRMGAMRAPGERWDLDELKRRLAIAPKHDRYFEALMRRLAAEGLVTMDGRRVETTDAVAHDALSDVEREVAEFKEAFPRSYPACGGLLNFAVSCLSRYEEIVTGRLNATDVLFGEDESDVFAAVFRGDAVSDYFNRIVATAVRSAVVHLLRRNAGEG